MKKIINGKKYDTETACRVGSDGYDGSSRDFQYWEEVLYRKKTGEYFLYGEGGPMSRYASSGDCGKSWGWGEEIAPLTDEDAFEWACDHMTVDEVEALFGVVEE